MKKERGITLVALVITIIILLILAGVALSALTGNDSIIKNAETVVEGYNTQQEADDAVLNSIAGYLEQHMQGGGNNPPPAGELTPLTGTAEVNASGLATKKTLIKPDANSNIQIVIPEGFAPAILAGSTSTTSLPGQDGSVASIMPADQWKNITISQINQGIVIVDHAITYDNGQETGTVPDFNEFVWVPIPESSKFRRTEWTTPDKNPDNGALLEGTEVKHLLSEEAIENRWYDDKTTTEYTNMVSSVNQYKGFYIGRYEACLNGTIAHSRRGLYPTVEISQTNSITACSNNTSIPNMHLIYGIEWDSTLNWLIGNATIASSTEGAFGTEGTTKTMGLADIQTNSDTWGNYVSSNGNATSSPWRACVNQYTGASEYWKANNIYDLAGNIWEWTQEKIYAGTTERLRSSWWLL